MEYNSEIIGYIKIEDIEKYRNNTDFEKKGGLKDKKGIMLIGVCGNPNYSGVASPILKKIDEYAKVNSYNYILLHALKDRGYLHNSTKNGKNRNGLYTKHDYIKIGTIDNMFIMRKDIPI